MAGVGVWDMGYWCGWGGGCVIWVGIGVVGEGIWEPGGKWKMESRAAHLELFSSGS